MITKNEKAIIAEYEIEQKEKEIDIYTVGETECSNCGVALYPENYNFDKNKNVFCPTCFYQGGKWR
jgi:predicted  nucleic acid-binding Zn-ribbon protein